MAIKDDILTLVAKQEQLYKDNGRYVQALPTPELIPTVGSDTKITELSKPEDVGTKISFTPTAKDYQFSVNVMSRLNPDKTEDHGYLVIAKRDLGDGIIETITAGKEIV